LNPSFSLADGVFYLIAALTVGSGLYAILARNIVRAVFALLVTFACMAGLYAMLSADFVAIVQLMVYVGGILVLMLFAVMLTSQIERAATSNPSAGLAGMIFGLLVGMASLALLVGLAVKAPWNQAPAGEFAPTTAGIGQQLLSGALLPFELLSVVLLAVIIGAVVVARLKKTSRSVNT
jgi:NAD(P)H-quinone oxidoreductase subunit 6